MHDSSETNSAEKEFYYYDIATKENVNEKKPKDGNLILNLAVIVIY